MVKEQKKRGKRRVTNWAIGIHIKRRVAVHPEIDPTSPLPLGESLPIFAIPIVATAMRKAIEPGNILGGM